MKCVISLALVPLYELPKLAPYSTVIYTNTVYTHPRTTVLLAPALI